MAHDHTYVSGEILTAANLNDLVSGRVGYAAVTASQTSITTITDLTSLTLTFTAIASRYYRITGFVTSWSATAGSPTSVSLYITNGSNTVQTGASAAVISAAAFGPFVMAIVSPGAGSVTYKLRGEANTGTVTANASATIPMFIVVEDIGS